MFRIYAYLRKVLGEFLDIGAVLSDDILVYPRGRVHRRGLHRVRLFTYLRQSCGEKKHDKLFKWIQKLNNFKENDDYFNFNLFHPNVLTLAPLFKSNETILFKEFSFLYIPKPILLWGPCSVMVPVGESGGGISTDTPVSFKISWMVVPRAPITYLCWDFGTSTRTVEHFFCCLRKPKGFKQLFALQVKGLHGDFYHTGQKKLQLTLLLFYFVKEFLLCYLWCWLR